MITKLKIFTIFIFAIFAGIFLASKGSTQTKIETAGQKFKSIKVLNEMPADQMGKVMNMMAASLGVNCKFCHAANDGDYEKEGFEHKDIARRMLKMTFEMNKNYFDGRTEINCSTCHQGRPVPQSAIPLIPVVREPRPEPLEKKPAIDEILAKYEAALGGRANLAKITSRRIKAQRLEPDGETFENEEILQKGVKMSVTTIYPSKQYGDYLVREVFDGRRAEKFGNGAKIELKPDETEQIEREAEVFVNPDLRAVFSEIVFDSIKKVDGREVFVLLAKTAENSFEKLYFDIQTGFLVRRVAPAPTILGEFVYQVDYTEYKDFGGVRLPTVIKFAVPNIRWTRKVLEVKNNVAIDDAKFSGK
jgi:photosynthetic reaction center cytochrome c subunit